MEVQRKGKGGESTGVVEVSLVAADDVAWVGHVDFG